ncbi:hypothetical protein DXG01_006448 [Tephrocybe rancida]|nr:hypothetical protein DXG01_006448 [Tephrocybe rancida]
MPLAETLPTETIRLIFLQLYLDSQTEPWRKHDHCEPEPDATEEQQLLGNSLLAARTTCYCTPEDKLYTTVWSAFDPKEPLVFPYTIAAVNTRWRDIAESFPYFWTRLVIFVDQDATPLADIRKHLLLTTQAEQLDVIVMRHPRIYDKSDLEEYDRARAVIDILLPHVHRFHSLTFDVVNTSSLPSVLHDFAGIVAPFLTKLELKARCDDGTSFGDRSASYAAQRHAKPFYCPNITHLTIDGRNFAHASMGRTSWITKSCEGRASTALHLTISTFSPSPMLPKDRNFTINHLISALTPLTSRSSYLNFSEVEFVHEGFRKAPLQERVALNVWELSFVGLSARFLKVLLDAVNWGNTEFVEIDRCGLAGVRAPDFMEAQLRVCNIAVEEDMFSFFDRWDWDSLLVANCPGFDDAAMKAFQPSSYGGSGLFLTVSGCKGYSIEGLRDMVERLNEHEYLPRTLAWLKIDGGPRALTEDEEDFFQSSMRHFGRTEHGNVAKIVDGDMCGYLVDSGEAAMPGEMPSKEQYGHRWVFVGAKTRQVASMEIEYFNEEEGTRQLQFMVPYSENKCKFQSGEAKRQGWAQMPEPQSLPLKVIEVELVNVLTFVAYDFSRAACETCFIQIVKVPDAKASYVPW